MKCIVRQLSARRATLAIAALAMISCSREPEGVKVYEVIVPPGMAENAGKTDPMSAMGSMGALAAAPDSGKPQPVHWQVPPDWQVQPLSALINRGNYLLPSSAGTQPSLSISAYPDSAGGVVANINRWRRQLGLPEEQSEESSITEVVVDNQRIATCYLEGKRPDGSAGAIAAAILSLPGETWFFKLNGAKESVAASRGGFDQFIRSLKIDSPGGATTASPKSTGAATKPGFDKPENWQEAPTGSMSVANFQIPGPDGTNADIAVLNLAGGTDLDNINLWRQQLGLAPINSDTAPSTESLGSHKVRIFDEHDSAEPPTSKRIVAAIIRANDTVWIVRMRGNTRHLEMEMANFRAFVSSLRLP